MPAFTQLSGNLKNYYPNQKGNFANFIIESEQADLTKKGLKTFLKCRTFSPDVIAFLNTHNSGDPLQKWIYGETTTVSRQKKNEIGVYENEIGADGKPIYELITTIDRVL